MTKTEYEALKKRLDDATTRLDALKKEQETLSEMIITLATVLAKGNQPVDPIVAMYNHDVIGSGTNQHTYTGSWAAFSKTGLYQNSGRFSNTVNGTITFTGWGTKLEWITEYWENHGKAAVSIDGGAETEVDLYSASTTLLQEVVWSSGVLTEGLHTVVVRITGEKNASASAAYVVHGAFRVSSRNAAPTPPPPSDDDAYYVAEGASGVGTFANPMSITAAFAAAASGDKIVLRGGTYRVTPVVAHDGVIIQSYPGETVYISGLEAVGDTGWTVHSGSIYRKNITLPVANNFLTSTSNSNTVLLANQIFKGNDMQFLARWPKITAPEHYLDKTKMRTRAQTSTFNNNTVVDSGFGLLGIANNALSGAQIFTNGWFLSETRQISNNTGSTITYASGTINSDAYRKFYYITNALALLTDEKEWHYTSGVLYYKQPGGGSPTGLQYKARNYGIDIRGRTGITITGINFIGCDPVWTNSSSSYTLDNNKITYCNHGFLTPNSNPDYFYNARQVGTRAEGANCIIRNNEWKYGIQGIWAGSNARVENNKFEYFGYDGTYASPLAFINGANGIVVTKNTMWYCGRSNIHLGAYVSGNQTAATYLNMDISYNDLGYHSMLLIDGGSIYSNIRTNLTGTVIHHNWMHHNMVSRVGGVDGVQVTGIYMDQASGPITEHHNITFAGDECDWYAEQHADVDNGWSPPAPVRNVQHFHYNSTLAGTTDRSIITYASGVTADVWRNCIFLGNISASTTQNIANSIMKASNPLFVGGSLSSPQTYFQLQSGSPARGAGTSISGVNEDDTSPKEAGAYYYQQAAWVPGYNSLPYTP